MFNILAGLIAFFYDNVIHDYAAAITLLTATVMLVLTPLTWKGTRSMLAMQRLQPEIKKLQAKHKSDKQALNEAMMAFYKEHQVNPVSGCLPQLVQFPVLIVMFRVISGLTHLNHDGFPKYVVHTTELAKALKASGGHMVSLGMDLSKAASRTHGGDAFPLYILIGLVVASSFWQSRQMTARNPAANANPQMQIMQRVFPLISGLISFNLPAGVVLYFLISNLFRIGQQALMYRVDPTLSAEVKKEVKEIDAKADEIERQHKAGGSKPTSGGSSSGRVTPSARAGQGGNGAQANGARQASRPNSRRSRRRRSRKR
jgi:YidC/Oxa1 family membrane protein insertase